MVGNADNLDLYHFDLSFYLLVGVVVAVDLVVIEQYLYSHVE